MIRTMHPYDFTRNLGLTRLIPERVQDEACAAGVRKNRRIALCMHLYFMDMLPQSCAFAANMPFIRFRKICWTFLVLITRKKKW